MSALSWVRAACLVAFALSVAVWDVRCRRVPNALALAGFVVGLGLAAAGGWVSVTGSLWGAAAFGGPLLLAWFAGLVGAGDAKAAFAFGALLGMPGAIAALLWGAVAGAVLAVATSGAVLVRSAGALRLARRQGGWPGAAAVVVSHPAWQAGIPYAAALAVGSLWVLVEMGLRL